MKIMNQIVLWIIKDETIINKIINNFKDKKIIIVDGHHRYETSMDYIKEMLQKKIK